MIAVWDAACDAIDAASQNTVIAAGFAVLVVLASVDLWLRRRWRS